MAINGVGERTFAKGTPSAVEFGIGINLKPARPKSGSTLRRQLAAGVIAFAVAIASALGTAPSPALAHSTTAVPYHQANTVNCFNGTSGRTVRAFAASQMRSVTGSRENVRWGSDLYRWNGSSWALFDASTGWLHGAANGNGLLPLNSAGNKWFNPATGGYLNSWTYTSLSSGYYMVLQFYRWDYNGLQHTEWSPIYNNTYASYCYF